MSRENPIERGGGSRQPQFVEEAEVLVGASAFYDEERTDLLQEDFEELDPLVLGARSLLYVRSLRLLAEERHEDRRNQSGRRFKGKEFNERWRLTYKRLATVAFQHQEKIASINTELAFINNVEEFVDTRMGTLLKPHQEEFLEEIVGFIQGPPQLTESIDSYTGKKTERYIKGATIIAPTGAGKTAIMAQGAMALGIGKKPNGKGDPLSLLIVVPSQDLVEQFTGKSGDDTFRRFAPGLSVTGYYQHERDATGDVVVVTKDKFIQDFKEGCLAGRKFNLIEIDEVHCLTEPRFYETFQKEWDGIVLGYTATPDYHPGKDARKILPHVIQKGEIIPYIVDEILNGAQLNTFVIEPRHYADQMPDIDLNDPKIRRRIGREMLDNAAFDYTKAQLLEGRRGIVFCEKGGKSEHARAMAARLSTVKVPDGKGGERFIVAEAIGSFLGRKNREIINQYHAGEIDVLCSTEKGKQGLNADIDFVVINARVGSFLKLRQMVGRGTRKSKRFPITRYADFVMPLLDGDRGNIFTLPQAFGLDSVEQGYTISKDENSEAGVAESLSYLPPYLQELCRKVHGKKLADLLITSELRQGEVPAGHVPLSVIVAESGLEESWVMSRLQRAGYAYVGRTEMVDNERKFVRYYEPGARTYFQDNPIAPFETPDLKSVQRLAKEWSVPRSLVESLAKKERIIGHRRTLLTNGREGLFFNENEIARMKARLDSIPIAGPGDVTVWELAQELGCSRNYIYRLYPAGKKPVDMRRRTDEDDESSRNHKGFVPHVLAVDAAQFRELFKSIPYAGPDDFSQNDIARALGVLHRDVFYVATDAEIKSGRPRRKPDDNRVLTYWPRHVAEAVIERSQRQRNGLPAHLLPHSVVADIVQLRPRVAYQKLKAAHTPEKIRIEANAPMSCFTWQAIQQLEEKYGRKEGGVVIDYSRVPLDSHDKDPSKIEYAQRLQRQLLPGVRLAAYGSNS